jgi:hypothetical protein
MTVWKAVYIRHSEGQALHNMELRLPFLEAPWIVFRDYLTCFALSALVVVFLLLSLLLFLL